MKLDWWGTTPNWHMWDTDGVRATARVKFDGGGLYADVDFNIKVETVGKPVQMKLRTMRIWGWMGAVRSKGLTLIPDDDLTLVGGKTFLTISCGIRGQVPAPWKSGIQVDHFTQPAA